IGLSAGVDQGGGPLILVTQDTKNQIGVYTPDGTLIRYVGAQQGGSGDGQLSAPRDAATDADGNIYVADYGNNRIAKFSPSGDWLLNWGGAGGQPGRFRHPYGITLDAENHVYVADSINQRMQRFDTATSAFQLKWGERGWGGDLLGFNWPRDLTPSAATNTLWVADTKNSRLVEFDPDGTPSGRTFGSPGAA